MITWHPSIPPWKVNTNRMLPTYWKILSNFARCCDADNVLFIDNGYLDGMQVRDAIGQHKKVIIFNMVDSPYDWHHLEWHLRDLDIEIMCVGTESPDFHTWFVPAWLHAEWRFSNNDDLLMNVTNHSNVFLCYNYKPHEHRQRLKSWMEKTDVINLGVFTLHDTDLVSNPMGREINIGDMDVWRSHFVNIVSETIFSLHPELILSEKTIKPILGLRPFVINGSPRYYEVLESVGIDVFSDVFPAAEMSQPSDNLSDCMDRNHEIICDLVKRLSQINLVDLYQQLLPRLLRNQDCMRQLMAEAHQHLCVNDIEIKWRRPCQSHALKI